MRHDRRVLLHAALALACSSCRPDAAPAASPASSSLVAARLCVSSGELEALGSSRSRVDVGGMRAEVTGDFSRTAEITFVYGGPSATSAPLANGELRRQIGLKLRARDTCNVVYVMWRIAPASGVYVSVKRNPGMSTHAECGDRGYANVRSVPLPTTAPTPALGSTHTLRAVIAADDRTLRVFADGTRVFEAVLPEDALSFDGPAGVRTDNGRFDFELRLPEGASRGSPTCPGAGHGPRASTLSRAAFARAPAPAERARGMWVWSTKNRLGDPNGTTSLLETCRTAQLNEIYLSVNGGVLDGDGLPALMLALRERGIRVEALMGEATWYRPDARAPMFAMIDAVAAYDARHPEAPFAAIHLDIEPHQIPANKGDHRFLPELARTLLEATTHAARAALGSSADLPRFALDEQGPAFAAAVDRPFVMLYQLRDRSPDWLVRQSASVLAHTYGAASNDLASRLVVGLRVDDYPADLEAMLGALDQGHGQRPRYAGWAVHDEAKFRARNVNMGAERQAHDGAPTAVTHSTEESPASSPSR